MGWLSVSWTQWGRGGGRAGGQEWVLGWQVGLRGPRGGVYRERVEPFGVTSRFRLWPGVGRAIDDEDGRLRPESPRSQ